jgi:thymidylate kinase
MSSNGVALASSSRPLVVEFVGTPGSGKTTLSMELVGLLQENGIEAATLLQAARRHAARTLAGRAVVRLAPNSLRPPLLWQAFYLLSVLHILGFRRDHPSLARQAWRTQLGRPLPTATKRHILFWFFQLAGRLRFLTETSHAREVLVLDDGFLHRSVHLNASHVEDPNADQVTTYVDLLPEPDLVVFTEASKEVCERRILARGVWPHRRHLNTAELSRYLENAERVAHLAVQRARERGWTIVEIQNEDREPNRIRNDLRAALGPFLAGAFSGSRPKTEAAS